MAESPSLSRSGLTLPMWVAAAARAATQRLAEGSVVLQQPLLQPDGAAEVTVPVRAVAGLADQMQVLAMAVCDPGPGLDLTRGLEVWVRVGWSARAEPWLDLVAGEGVGRSSETGRICLSAFARQLLELNLRSFVPADRGLLVEVVLPRGRELGQRTSNEAFGVVEGLALIGTQAEVQVSASPDQLRSCLDQLKALTSRSDFGGRITLVIGENGRDLASQLGLDDVCPLLKTGNWIGPMLVAAAEAGVEQLLLFGYQGKLLKLAGGIFHTHHHLADGRLEVLTALAVDLGLPLEQLRILRAAASVEEAMAALQQTMSADAESLRAAMANGVEERALAYLRRYGDWPMEVGAVLFDRSRQSRWAGARAEALLATWQLSL